MYEQMDVFDAVPATPLQLYNDLKKTKRELDNVRKGLFKRHAEIIKEVAELKDYIMPSPAMGFVGSANKWVFGQKTYEDW